MDEPKPQQPIFQTPTIESDGTPDAFRVRDSVTGKDFALRLGTEEQLTRLQSVLYEQFQGYNAQVGQMMMLMANALAGSNIIAYELERRKLAQEEAPRNPLNGAGEGAD